MFKTPTCDICGDKPLNTPQSNGAILCEICSNASPHYYFFFSQKWSPLLKDECHIISTECDHYYHKTWLNTPSIPRIYIGVVRTDTNISDQLDTMLDNLTKHTDLTPYLKGNNQ